MGSSQATAVDPSSILPHSVNVFDRYTKTDYKIFSDCAKLTALLSAKDRKVLGRGTYGEVVRYCSSAECSSGYALRKTIEVPEFPDDPSDRYWASRRIGFILNLFIVNGLTPHIIPTLGHFVCAGRDKTSDEYVTIMPLVEGDVWSQREILLASTEHVRQILFQLIFTLAAIQCHFPSFKHNDLSLTNILYIRTSGKGTYLYKIGDLVFRLPDSGYRYFLADWDLSCIPGVIENDDVPLNNDPYYVSDSFNQFYDLGSLVDAIWYFVPDESMSTIQKFIEPIHPETIRIVPETKYSTAHQVFNQDKEDLDIRRPIINLQVMTPLDALRTTLFEPWRIKTDSSAPEIKDLETFDANRSLPRLETSILKDRFSSCYTTAFFLPSDPIRITRMMDTVLAKHCTLKGRRLDTPLGELRLDDSKIIWINNFTADPFTHKDVQGLAEFIYRDLCDNYLHYWETKITATDYTKLLADIIKSKILLYFILNPLIEDLMEIYGLTNHHRLVLYHQLQITPALVRAYMARRASSS